MNVATMYQEHRAQVDALKTNLEAHLRAARIGMNWPANLMQLLVAAEEVVLEARAQLIETRTELERVQSELARRYE